MGKILLGKIIGIVLLIIVVGVLSGVTVKKWINREPIIPTPDQQQPGGIVTPGPSEQPGTEEPITPAIGQLTVVEQAKTKCVELCESGKPIMDFSKGPCLSNKIIDNWVCDVAHSPRKAVDNLLANQCPAFGKTAQYFVEVNADCKIINVFGPKEPLPPPVTSPPVTPPPVTPPPVTPSVQPSSWRTVSSPNGFRLSTPTSYAVTVSEDGVVKAESGSTKTVVEAIYLSETKSGRDVLDEALPLIKETVGNFEVTSITQPPNYPNSYIATIKQGDKVGGLILTLDGMKGFLAGMFDDKTKYRAKVEEMVKIINSFQYDNAIKQPAVVGMTELYNWTDPKEGAFTIELPKGWSISSDSGITRPYLDASVKIVATKGNMGFSVEQLHPPLYYTPNWVLNLSGFPEGSAYMGGIVKRYYNAKQYIQNVLPAELGFGAPISVADRPDLIANIYRAPWITEATAAEASFNEMRSGQKIIHNAMIGDEYYEMSGIGMWAVSMIHYWGPEDEFDKAARIVDKVMESFKVDANWAKREQQQVAARTGLINALGDDISKIVKSTFEYRDRVLDRMSTRFSNAILGVAEVYDAVTGQSYTVPNDAKNYWKYFDTIIGTETDTPPLNDPNVRKLYCPEC